MNSLLTPVQLQRLRDHQYRSQGTSLSEVIMQPYWRWLVTKVPLWVAPNLITFVGLLINLFTSLLVVVSDPNSEGTAPRWTYFSCAAGFFIYQSLDAIDGKQARRTGSNNPLGELFDHGCDAVSTFLVVISAISAVGLQEYPQIILIFVVLLLVLNFSYHWQTYVSGILHFKKLDVTEAQFLHMAVLLFTTFLGIEAWNYQIPGLSISLKLLVVVVTLTVSTVNLLHAFYIIVTSGVGKNGSTVADTSVVSPIVTPLILSPLPFLYARASPLLLHTRCMLFLTATCLPFVKPVIKLMVASMTKSPFPLLDPIMLGPLLAYLNLYFGTPLPELYVVTAIANLSLKDIAGSDIMKLKVSRRIYASLIYNVLDISVLCVSLCRQICDYLNISCFTIPNPPPMRNDPH